MEIFNLEPIQAVIMLGMIAGVVEFVKHFCAFLAKDTDEWKPCAIIATAGITGALTALALAINPLIGAVVGFAASGYITIAQNIGKKS